jgi:hypothetical protein
MSDTSGGDWRDDGFESAVFCWREDDVSWRVRATRRGT